MSAPSKANISKLDNPARVTLYKQHGTGKNHAYEKITSHVKPWEGHIVEARRQGNACLMSPVATGEIHKSGSVRGIETPHVNN